MGQTMSMFFGGPPKVSIGMDCRETKGVFIKKGKCEIEYGGISLIMIKQVQCPQCSDYYYLSQDNSVHLALFNLLDTLIRTGAPYIAALGLGGSFLISCTTYGAFTIMTLFGAKDGERLIGNPALWTWKTWTGLPMIPILLLASETRWGDFVLPVAAVTTLRATGVSPNKIKLTWPISPALTIGLMPWVR
jgi:hypothetical protein